MARIKSKKIKSYKGKVHDLTVEKTSCYNIEGLGVHNSACGSLLTWLLDITKIDPVLHNLYFERFLNPSRNCLTEDCMILMKDGSYKKVGEVKAGDPVKTSTGVGELVQTHVRNISDDEYVYEIESCDGSKIKLTGNHIIPVERDGNKIEIRVDELLETDIVYTL